MTRTISRLALGLLALAVAACTPNTPPTRSDTPKLAQTPSPVAAIRAAGTGDDSVVQVAPLRDAGVEGWLKEASAAEAKRDWPGAIAAAEKALKLAPSAPDILQDLAELEVARGGYVRAEELAMKSYRLGPQVGALCAKNWQTLVETRTAMNDAIERDKAMAQVKACRKQGPMRG
ncbi:MAG: tetratricopeptide repeat protein [Dokdonella sp.]